MTNLALRHTSIEVNCSLHSLSFRKVDSNGVIYLPPEDIRALEEQDRQLVLPTRPSCTCLQHRVWAGDSGEASKLRICSVDLANSQSLSLLSRGVPEDNSRCWSESLSKRPYSRRYWVQMADNLNPLTAHLFPLNCALWESENKY